MELVYRNAKRPIGSSFFLSHTLFKWTIRFTVPLLMGIKVVATFSPLTSNDILVRVPCALLE